MTTEDQEKLKSKTDDGNNRGSADKPMKRGGKTDNSSAEVVKDIFAVSKDTRANEKRKTNLIISGKMMASTYRSQEYH